MMTPSQTAFARWFDPMVAGVLAVIGLCGFVVITAGHARAAAVVHRAAVARVAASKAWSAPSSGSTASSVPKVAPPSVESVLVKAGCPRATVTTEVPGMATCYRKPGVLLMADTYMTTADRDANVTDMLNAGAVTIPPEVLVGPGWTVEVAVSDDGYTKTSTLVTEQHAALVAVAKRIGGAIRKA